MCWTQLMVMGLMALALLPAPHAGAQELHVRPTGMELQEFAYPFPVSRFDFASQGQTLSMAYMDVRPAQPNGRTIVLLHGKNFCGATWEGTIRPLQAAGYRVIVPDQAGFCRSTKPQGYQFSLHQLAANTRALLRHLDAGRVTMIGHSMGGMLTMRHALLYPDDLDGIVLINPIGLEDWQAEGVPYRTIDQWYAGEQQVSFPGVKAYQQATYYAGEWRPDYDRWVEMLAGMYVGEGRERVAWNQAQM